MLLLVDPASIRSATRSGQDAGRDYVMPWFLTAECRGPKLPPL